MCRLILGIATSPEAIEKLSEALWNFYRAAELDLKLEMVIREYVNPPPTFSPSHCDGYGYVALIWKRGRIQPISLYEKFDAYSSKHDVLDRNICRENLVALRCAVETLNSRLALAEKAVVLFHARKASRGQPRGTKHAHPYQAVLDTVYGPLELFLAHNGSVRREEIAKLLGLYPYTNYTDSYLLLQLVSRYVESTGSLEKLHDNLVEALSKGSKFEERGYNVALVAYDPYSEEIHVVFSGRLREDARSKARIEYYKTYTYLEPSLLLWLSSTIKDNLGASSSFRQEYFTEIDNKVCKVFIENSQPRYMCKKL